LVKERGIFMENQTTTTVPEISPEKKRMILKKKIKRNYSFASQGILYQFGLMNVCQIAVILIGIIIMSIKAAICGDIDGLTNTVNNLITSKGLTLIATAVGGILADSLAIVILLKFTKIGSVKEWISKPALSPIYIILGCFAVLGASNFNVSVLSLLGDVFTKTAENIDNSLTFDPSKPVSFIAISLYVCIVGPILEELLCRGVLLNLCSQVSVKFGIFMSAMLFGIMHMNFIQGVNAFVMGLILAYIACKSKSLVAPILVHMFNNTSAVVFTVIANQLSESASNTLSYIFTFGSIGIGAICLVILFVKNGKLKEGEKVPAKISVRPGLLEELEIKNSEVTAKSFFSCVAFYIVIILFLINALAAAFLPQITETIQNLPK